MLNTEMHQDGGHRVVHRHGRKGAPFSLPRSMGLKRFLHRAFEGTLMVSSQEMLCEPRLIFPREAVAHLGNLDEVVEQPMQGRRVWCLGQEGVALQCAHVEQEGRGVPDALLCAIEGRWRSRRHHVVVVKIHNDPTKS